MNKYDNYLDKNEYELVDLKKAQDVLLETLTYFDEFCKKIGVKYFLFFGTLLGAFREKDIIAWDDDIDVVVSLSDYNKILANASLLEEPYALFNKYTHKKCEIRYSRILNKNMVYFKKDFRHSKTEPNFSYIDVFIMENPPKDKKYFDIIISKTRFDRFILNYKYNYYEPTLRSKILKSALRFLLLPFSSKKALDRIDHKLDKYLHIDQDLSHVIIPTNGAKAFTEIYDASSFLSTQLLLLRNKSFQCPINAEAILSTFYGSNFRTPIPPSEREPEKYFYVRKNRNTF